MFAMALHVAKRSEPSTIWGVSCKAKKQWTPEASVFIFGWYVSPLSLVGDLALAPAPAVSLAPARVPALPLAAVLASAFALSLAAALAPAFALPLAAALALAPVLAPAVAPALAVAPEHSVIKARF